MSNDKHASTLKQELIDDLKRSITYIPDRNRDINCMLNNLSSHNIDPKTKEDILDNLANCINRQAYKQPEGIICKHYSQMDIDELSRIMDEFSENIQNPDSNNKEEIMESLKNNLKDLQVKTKLYLIDTWRRDQLYEWVEAVNEMISFSDNDLDSEPKNLIGMEQLL